MSLYKVNYQVMDYSYTIRLNDRDSNSINFNPSLAFITKTADGGNVYLYCYRSFLRYKNVHTENYEGPIPLEYNMNHPWYTPFHWGSSANMVGKRENYDSTKFSLIKLSNEGELVAYLNTGFELPKRNDARLLRLKKFMIDDKPTIICTYNVVLKNRDDLQLREDTCNNWCTLIESIVLTCDLTNFNPIDLSGMKIDGKAPTILCPQISFQTEKNWSLFETDNGVCFSYNIHPTHTVYNINIDNEGKLFCTGMNEFPTCRYIDNLKSVYGDKFKISITTPLVSSVILGPHMKIGVGHVKWFGELTDGQPGYAFKIFDKKYDKVKRISRHLKNVKYLFYIYYYNTQSNQIESVSDIFMIEPYSVLCFPSGIENIPDTDIFLLVYGSEDFKCKMMVFSESELLSQQKLKMNNCDSFSGNVAVVDSEPELKYDELRAKQLWNPQ